ncbi:MAG: hypothetical protein II664_08690 [Oscillospiraceae bacterium]|nr:hypothetical protein [Oscillospiraceae bacterium]
MAMQCPECGKNYDKKYDKCPFCGHTAAKRRRKAQSDVFHAVRSGSSDKTALAANLRKILIAEIIALVLAAAGIAVLTAAKNGAFKPHNEPLSDSELAAACCEYITTDNISGMTGYLRSYDIFGDNDTFEICFRMEDMQGRISSLMYLYERAHAENAAGSDITAMIAPICDIWYDGRYFAKCRENYENSGARSEQLDRMYELADDYKDRAYELCAAIVKTDLGITDNEIEEYIAMGLDGAKRLEKRAEKSFGEDEHDTEE